MTSSVFDFVDCHYLAEQCLKRQDFDITDCYFNKDDISLGFIASSKKLCIVTHISGEYKTLRFFIKTFPTNPLHQEKVIQTRLFFKEAEFFNKIQPNILKYQTTTRCVPRCFFANENIIVLEDLQVSEYKNFPIMSTFDLAHCKVTLQSLAEIHASSLLYENEQKTTIEKQFPELMFISWYAEREDHPGNIHLQTGIRALNALICKYFNDIPEKLKDEVISLCKSLPIRLRPSKKFKNSVSHYDLWCNNIMFNYQNGNVNKACILDFQLFAYNPPSLDVLLLIYLNTDKDFREEYMDYLLKYYYDCLSQIIKKNNQDSHELFSKDEFMESITEVLPTVLTSSVLFLHFVLLPEEEVTVIMNDKVKYKQFMEKDRNEFILNMIEQNTVYRTRVLTSLSDLINYTKAALCIS